ncbi:unnamed protein product [Cuscuta campestris]|uniref:Uncharacterized protein n=1 Tax=Cuscuta campestris TaxID=132261 RepID=A0A484NT73_9ASTE|nr:unnamed protein product [Cuscuta campestris]
MGEEDETSQVTRRATRLSTSSGELKTNDVVPELKPLTVNDLAFGNESITFDELMSSLPGRQPQIRQLLHLLGPLNSPIYPLFMYGGASVGKTSTILQTFKYLKRPFVYCSCITCYSPRILFESILNQLLLHRRTESNGYSSAKRCSDRPSDFVNLLQEALAKVVDDLKRNEEMQECNKKSAQRNANGRMIYLVFDNLELMRGWDKHETLPFLFKLNDVLKRPEVGLIFISRTSPDTYFSDNVGCVEFVDVYFPDYTEDDLRQILMRNQANPKLYSSFLGVVLRSFCRVTRRIDELSAALSPLFKIYCEPLDDTGAVPNQEMTNRLINHLKPHIGRSMNEVFRVLSRPSSETTASNETKHNKVFESKSSGQVDFHMSVCAKYLLISAFIASRNPATLDASLFDPTGGCSSRKKKRKVSQKSVEQKEITEQESLMKGPGTFPLERLLAIFQCITSIDEEEEATEGKRLENGLTSDVLLQLSSLCNANFISKGGSCPLEGSIRYRSLVSEDLALKVARSLQFPLSKYLYR